MAPQLLQGLIDAAGCLIRGDASAEADCALTLKRALAGTATGAAAWRDVLADAGRCLGATGRAGGGDRIRSTGPLPGLRRQMASRRAAAAVMAIAAGHVSIAATKWTCTPHAFACFGLQYLEALTSSECFRIYQPACIPTHSPCSLP